jgi:hypothetical protein
MRSVPFGSYSCRMDSTCPACGELVPGTETVCPACHADLGAAMSSGNTASPAATAAAPIGTDASPDPDVGASQSRVGTAVSSARQDMHISPDGGIQTYLQPDGATLGPHVPSREILHVAAVRGAWAQIVIDGEVVGWVDGRRLLPPAGESISPQVVVEQQTPVTSIGAPAMRVDGLVGALAAIGVMVGALLDWTQGIALNSFKLPVAFLFDPNTTSRDPRLGYLLVGVGLLGLLFSFVRGTALLRILLGGLALGVAMLYCGQIAHEISKTGSSGSFTDVVGAGPWVTGISGLVLLLSPIFGSRE